MLRASKHRRSRRGVAAAELAVCLPVLVLIALAMIETCTMIFLKQSLAVAAYEGAHMAVKPGATSDDVRDVCEAILRDRRVSGGEVLLDPASVEDATEGTFITVTVTAPTDANAVLPGKFFRGKTLVGKAEFVKEVPR